MEATSVEGPERGEPLTSMLPDMKTQSRILYVYVILLARKMPWSLKMGRMEYLKWVLILVMMWLVRVVGIWSIYLSG